MIQKTFMMLKPDAFETGCAKEVEAELKRHGLRIAKSCEVKVTMDVMKTLIDHYSGVIDAMSKDFDFPGKLFNSFYYDGPHTIQPMEIEYEGEEDIITLTRTLAGKTNPAEAASDTIRGRFSNDNYDKANAEVRLVNNVIHASDSHESAKRELAIWSAYLK